MKKILILSDSHGNFEKILKIFEKENPDEVIYTGDGLKDIEELSYLYDVKYHIVNGNCDFFEKNYGLSKLLEINGFRFFITHGHMYGVKNDLKQLRDEVKNQKAKVGIFGHTHKAILEKNKDFYLFNPGASENGRYGIILVENEKIKFFHKEI